MIVGFRVELPTLDNFHPGYFMITGVVLILLLVAVRLWIPRARRRFRHADHEVAGDKVMVRYQSHHAHNMRFRLMDDRQHKVARVSTIVLADITLNNIDLGEIQGRPTHLPILRLATGYKVDSKNTELATPLVIRILQSCFELDVVTLTHATEIRLKTSQLHHLRLIENLNLSFEIVNAVHYLETRKPSRKGKDPINLLIKDRPPFVLQEVALGISPLVGDSYICAQLDYPYSIAPRQRSISNLEFVSLTTGMGVEGQRQFAFVRQALQLRLVISSDDDFELSAPAVPFVLASFGFLAMALTVKMFPEGVNSPNNSDSLRIAVGQVIIGLALATSYVGIFRRRRLFFPSAQFGRLSAESWSLMLSIPVVIVAEMLVLLQFSGKSVWPFHFIHAESIALFTIALIYAGLALMYFALLQMGKLQYLLCDECGERTSVHPWSESGIWPETGEYLCRLHVRLKRGQG